MTTFPLYPIWGIDMLGSSLMILISAGCIHHTRKILLTHVQHPLARYLVWFTYALLIFAISRSFGHILKHILYFLDMNWLWKELSPISGAINSISFIIIASVTLFFGNIYDIMLQMLKDRKRIEQTSKEILKLTNDLENIISERSKAEMSLRLAHEIRNPVMVIGGMIHSLLKKNDEIRTPQFQAIMDEAQRLNELVTSFEKNMILPQVHYTQLELNSLTEEAIELVRPLAEQKKQVILLNRSPLNLFFYGNRQTVIMAIKHVIGNAIEACPEAATIEITTDLTENGNTLTIEDNGPGIAPEMLEHIFEPFYTTQKGKTTGLGLAYVKQIIEDHRGSIHISSPEGKGTIVSIYFPAYYPIK